MNAIPGRSEERVDVAADGVDIGDVDAGAGAGAGSNARAVDDDAVAVAIADDAGAGVHGADRVATLAMIFVDEDVDLREFHKKCCLWKVHKTGSCCLIEL